MSEDLDSEMADGHPDDIYEWFSSVPHEVRPVNKNFVRAETVFGVSIIGKMNNRPPKTSPEMPENRGVYISVIVQQDFKLGTWSIKLLLPIIHLTIESWGKNFRSYLNKNKSRLINHLEQMNEN